MPLHPSFLRTATPNQRMGAFAIDLLLINFPIAILLNPAVTGAPSGPLVLLAVFGGLLLAFAAFDGSQRGATPGKRLVGTRVVDAETGEPIGLGRGLLRRVVHFLGAVPLYAGWWWIHQ